MGFDATRMISILTRDLHRTYTVKSELDFRQMFHYCESQYRDLISAGVPFEGQSFGMDVYVIGYQGKKPVASDVASDTVGEMTDGESDLDEVRPWVDLCFFVPWRSVCSPAFLKCCHLERCASEQLTIDPSLSIQVLHNKATVPKKPLGGDDDAEGHGGANFPRDPEPISPTGWDQLVTDLPNEVGDRTLCALRPTNPKYSKTSYSVSTTSHS